MRDFELADSAMMRITLRGDKLLNSDIGNPVSMGANMSVQAGNNNDKIAGKLITLSGWDCDPVRTATVAIGGIMKFKLDELAMALPNPGDEIVCAGEGKVKSVDERTAPDPAGGELGRGIAISIEGGNHPTVTVIMHPLDDSEQRRQNRRRGII